MAKHRKTRSQKQHADIRRVAPVTTPTETGVTTHVSNYQFRFTPTSQAAPQSIGRAAVITTNYTFVIQDLRRTLILTLTVIAIQLILFFVTK